MTSSSSLQLQKIKAIFFDAGGTLFRPFPSVGEVYASVSRKYGLIADPKDLEFHFHTTWEKRDGLASLTSYSGEKEEKKWWRELVWDVFSKFGPIDQFEAFFEELYNQFKMPEVWQLFPDALPALQYFKKKNKIVGIISNWDSRLFGICKGLGIEQDLDFILASAVVGAAKPHPKIFQEALRKAQVAPEEALHVGDSLEDDVLGAQRVGIQALFLDRKGTRAASIHTISELQFLCGMFEDYMAG